jgi:hypothetical protein
VATSSACQEKVREIVLAAWRREPTAGRGRIESTGPATVELPSQGLPEPATGQSRIDGIAAEFDRKGPDEEIPF